MANSKSGANIIVANTLEAFVNNAVDFTVEVLFTSYSAPNTTLIVDNLLHLRDGMTVEINGDTVSLSSIDRATNTITVAGDYTGASTLTVPTPYYFHGTPYATNAHISRLDDASKVPMIYLMEVLTERGESIFTRGVRTTMRLHFLDVANFEDWTNDQHYSNVIEGMRDLVARFLDTFRTNKRYFTTLYTYNMVNHAKWGLYVGNKGHLNSLFNERLSGVELQMEVHAVPCEQVVSIPALPVIPPAPEATTGLASGAVTSTSVELSWDATTGAESYELETNGGTPQNLTNVTSYTAAGLDPSTLYTFRVRAVNAGGTGDWSDSVQETTQAGGGAPGVNVDLRTTDFSQFPAFADGMLPKQVDVSFNIESDTFNPTFFPFGTTGSTVSQVFSRQGDDFLIKANVVNPTGGAGGEHLIRINEADRARIGTKSNPYVKRTYVGDGQRMGNRANNRIENLRQPETFGFDVPNRSPVQNREYTTLKYFAENDGKFYLDIGVTVQYFGNSGTLREGLGIGTTDPYAVGWNNGQWKRGEGAATAGEDDGGPTFFHYFTRDENGPAIQYRWKLEATEGSDTIGSTQFSFQSIDDTKAHVIITATKTRMVGAQPTGRGKYWIIPVDDFFNTYITNEAFNPNAVIPSPNCDVDFFPDENPDPDWIIGGVFSQGYLYPSAYSTNPAYAQDFYNLNPSQNYIELISSAYHGNIIQLYPDSEFNNITDDAIFSTAVNMIAPELDSNLF